jgi:hypothetical protein
MTAKIQIWQYSIYITLHLLIITYMTSQRRDFFLWWAVIIRLSIFLCYYVTLFCGLWSYVNVIYVSHLSFFLSFFLSLVFFYLFSLQVQRLSLHMITLNHTHTHTHTHTHSVGLHWTGDRPDAKPSMWQHTTFTTAVTGIGLQIPKLRIGLHIPILRIGLHIPKLRNITKMRTEGFIPLNKTQQSGCFCRRGFISAAVRRVAWRCLNLNGRISTPERCYQGHVWKCGASGWELEIIVPFPRAS